MLRRVKSIGARQDDELLLDYFAGVLKLKLAGLGISVEDLNILIRGAELACSIFISAACMSNCGLFYSSFF